MSRETDTSLLEVERQDRKESKAKKNETNISVISAFPSYPAVLDIHHPHPNLIANPISTTTVPVTSSPHDTHPTIISSTQHVVSGLVNECDLNEMKECLTDHPKLTDVFKSPDDLIHALKVISSIRPNEKFSTSSGIFIQSDIQHPHTWWESVQQYIHPLWLIRFKNGEDRITNLKAIKSIFVGALLVVEESLQEREEVIKPKDPVSRIDVVKKLKNEQVINRMAEAITKAVNSMENLKQTYTGDAHACARIDMLTETIRDRLALIKTSLDFLK